MKENLSEELETKGRDKTKEIIANFIDGLLLIDAENKISLINLEAEKILDVREKEVINRKITALSGFPRISPLSDLFLKEEKETFRKEIQIKEDLVVEVTMIDMKKKGEKSETLVILRDVTREKMVERMKTEFVSLAAHQLRTPLSAIKWTLKIILDGDLGKISQEQREFLEKTYKSNERMISLINDLLNVTRIEEGRYLFKTTLTSLEAVAQFVVNSQKEQAERKEIKLELKKSQEPLPLVSIDVEKVRLAIQNLVDNAIRYTLPGGKVTVSLKCDKNELELSVSDTGVGIPEDQKHRVFSKFFRAANVMRTDTEGSGLGLFIVKNVIDAHSGRVWFESKENIGSTFHFTIPLRQERGFDESIG